MMFVLGGCHLLSGPFLGVWDVHLWMAALQLAHSFPVTVCLYPQT
jgi:hypothetical protein